MNLLASFDRGSRRSLAKKPAWLGLGPHQQCQVHLDAGGADDELYGARTARRLTLEGRQATKKTQKFYKEQREH